MIWIPEYGLWRMIGEDNTIKYIAPEYEEDDDFLSVENRTATGWAYDAIVCL